MRRVTVRDSAGALLDGLCERSGLGWPEQVEALIERASDPVQLRPLGCIHSALQAPPLDAVAYMRRKAALLGGHRGALLSETADELDRLLREQQHLLHNSGNSRTIPGSKIA